MRARGTIGKLWVPTSARLDRLALLCIGGEGPEAFGRHQRRSIVSGTYL